MTTSIPPATSRVARVRDGRGLEHAVALELEVHAAEQAERRLVVDDEDGFAGHDQTQPPRGGAS